MMNVAKLLVDCILFVAAKRHYCKPMLSSMCDKCQCICFQPSIQDRQLSMVEGVNIFLPLIPHLLF